MADRQIIVCDIQHDDELLAERRTFALDGTEYVIDLCEDDMVAFEQIWEQYLKAGRRVGRSAVRAKPTRTFGANVADVRAWALANGYEVSERGRIPGTVRAAYDAANNWSTAR